MGPRFLILARKFGHQYTNFSTNTRDRKSVYCTRNSLDELSIEQLARTLAEFAGENRDCNFKLMAREILGFLRNIVEVDGRLNPQDEQAIENIEAIFASANRFSVRKKLRAGLGAIRHKAGRFLSRRKPARDKQQKGSGETKE